MVRHGRHPAAGLGEEGGDVAGVEDPDAADLLSLLVPSCAEGVLVGVHLVDVRWLERRPLGQADGLRFIIVRTGVDGSGGERLQPELIVIRGLMGEKAGEARVIARRVALEVDLLEVRDHLAELAEIVVDKLASTAGHLLLAKLGQAGGEQMWL